jgi:hypothetical protein
VGMMVGDALADRHDAPVAVYSTAPYNGDGRADLVCVTVLWLAVSSA